MAIKNKVEVLDVNIIENRQRPSGLIENNVIRTLAAIPAKTLSGYDIIAFEKEGKFLCWYCTKGRPKEILLKKELPLSFVRLLGYYQAEGAKAKLSKRRGRTFSFSNTKISLVGDFLGLIGNLVDKSMLNVLLLHNKDLDERSIKQLIVNLENLGISKEKIKIRQANRLKEYSITVWLSNSILAEFIQNLNEKIQALIQCHKYEHLFEEYFKGVIAGDGTFYSYRDKNGSLHSRLELFEEKEVYARKYLDTLAGYEINGIIKKDKIKNLYTVTINNNWHDLLKLLKHDLFCYSPRHKERLIWTIREHNRYRSLRVLTKLNKNRFDIGHLKDLMKGSYSGAAHWLEKRQSEGLVKIAEDSRPKLWELTAEGVETRKLLASI